MLHSIKWNAEHNLNFIVLNLCPETLLLLVQGKKAKSVAKESAPSKEELRKTICDILKEVDFNTVSYSTKCL